MTSTDETLRRALHASTEAVDPDALWPLLRHRRQRRRQRRLAWRGALALGLAALLLVGVTRIDRDERPAPNVVAGPTPSPAPKPKGGTIDSVIKEGVLGPTGLALSKDGSLYISDFGGHRVLRRTPEASMTVVAGTGAPGDGGDGGPATSAQLNLPAGLALAADGTLYIADSGNNRVRKVTPDGSIVPVPGSSIPIVDAQMASPGPRAVAIAGNGDLIVAGDYPGTVLRIDAGGVTTVVAGGKSERSSGDGGPAVEATLDSARDVVARGDDIYVVDQNAVRRIDASGVITSVVGRGDDPTPVPLYPTSVAVAPGGDLYIADNIPGNVRRITPDGDVSIVAGTNWIGGTGDGGPALDGRLDGPVDLVVGNDGTVYVAEVGGCRVRVLHAPLPGIDGAPRLDKRMLAPTWLPAGFSDGGPVQEGGSGGTLVPMSGGGGMYAVCSTTWRHSKRYFNDLDPGGRPGSMIVLGVTEGEGAAFVGSGQSTPIDSPPPITVTVRGRPAQYTAGLDGRLSMLSWLEQPDLAVELVTRVAPGEPDVSLVDLIALADGLMPARSLDRPPAVGPSRFEGAVSGRPGCVDRRDDGCHDPEAAVTVVLSLGGVEAARVDTRAAGSFLVELPPGTYDLATTAPERGSICPARLTLYPGARQASAIGWPVTHPCPSDGPPPPPPSTG